MAKSSKSRRKHKTASPARAAGTSHKGKGRKTAAKPKAIKSSTPDRLDDFMDAAGRVLALPVEPSWRPAIKANLEVTLRFAAFVAEFALPDEAEPAPIFTA